MTSEQQTAAEKILDAQLLTWTIDSVEILNKTQPRLLQAIIAAMHQYRSPSPGWIKASERPHLKDFLPTLDDVQQAYEKSPALYKYAQAVDKFIDSLCAESPAKPEGEGKPTTKQLEQEFKDELSSLLKKYKGQIEVKGISRRVDSSENHVLEVVLFAKAYNKNGVEEISQFDLGRIVRGF